jgi:pimeloyl-ACP methyl ester carboxylesterase
MIAKPHRRTNVALPIDGVLKHMAVHEWGDTKNPRVVICVHGLSRNGRDFDVLADALSAEFRVLCPDIPGRGESDWLASAAHYAVPVYVQFINAMLTEFGIKTYDWVGTSMGGLIGMVMAATPGSAMRRFVVNDIGPALERVALERIAAYVGMSPLFPSYMTLFTAVSPLNAPFGPLTEEQQHHMVRTGCQERSDGQWEFKSDPKIGDAFRAGLAQPDADLWPLWHAVTQPTLILRGVHSDLLSAATLAKMLEAHPKTQPETRAITLADTGHAPMIMDAPTVASVHQFFSALA